MDIFKISGICEDDANRIMNSFRMRGLTPVKMPSHNGLTKTIYVRNESDPHDLNWEDTIYKIEEVLVLYNYDYTRSKEGYFDGGVYKCSKKYDSLYERCRFKDILNSSYGYLGNYVSTDTEVLRQTYEGWYKGKYHGGYKNRRGDMYKVNAIYNGIERTTGKFKTVVKWSDGTKTIVTSQNGNHLSREIAFSYAWVKKQYGSNSAFKRHVDKYVETWGYMGQIFFNDGDYQAQLSVRTKSNDIYDQVALVMTMKDFGGIEKVADILQEKTFNE